MTNYLDIKDFLLKKKYKLVIGADAEPFLNKKVRGKMTSQVAAGGVSVALEPVARAGNALFVARGRTEEDKETVDKNGLITVNHADPYTLKRIFLTEQELSDYYYGFANQVLWPLSHIAFEEPIFNPDWFANFTKVNKIFADSMQKNNAENKFYFINDYQLCLVPQFLKKDPKSIIALFWHIPWPTWEIFRVLPQKKQILESMLKCDYIAFHRGYQARNFISTVRRELEARIDEEKQTIYYANNATTIESMPMGIDTDNVAELADVDDTDFFTSLAKGLIGAPKEEVLYKELFAKNQVILGVDRLDYTKGLLVRLNALERFFQKNPQYKGKVTYLGFLALSRKEIPSYKTLKKLIESKANEINKKFGTKDWQPIQLLPGIFSRKDLMNLYKHASVCLVTPLDDGMNLVSKEFVVAAGQANNPGMLVLSQFAGSATDLTQALIVNPYDAEQTANAIKQALQMPQKERVERIKRMNTVLNEKNVYAWVLDFLKAAERAARENRKIEI